MKRSAGLIIGALGLLASAGCGDIIRSFIPVIPEENEPGIPDGGWGIDGEVADYLTLTQVSPDHGPFIGGTEVTLYGSGFSAETTVTISGRQIQVGNLQIISPVALRVTTPAGEPGPADVAVSVGGEKVVLEGGFTYDAVYLDPSSGPTAGGTHVTVLGKGVSFSQQVKALLGGAPLTDVEVVSATLLRGRTPPGADGPADLTLADPKGDMVVREAFTYYESTDPRSGGMGGGPIAGSLTVSVVSWLDRRAVPGAKVVVQHGRSFSYTALTDASGMAVFQAEDLKGPVTLTAAKEKFETSSLVDFDARDVTIFLLPIISPEPGPLPPGRLPGTIRGSVLFGGATGVGSTVWKIVPEPKASQVKRTYVFTTSPNPDWGPQQPIQSATIDFTAGSATAWPYSITGRTGNMAVYAVAGLYNTVTQAFDPYAMGIRRGVVVGPGEIVPVDLWVDIPLTEKVTIQLAEAPQELSQYRLRLAISLGADGVILRPDHEVEGIGPVDALTLGRLPPFGAWLADASYTVDLVLESEKPDGLPYARAVERSVLPVDGVILLDRFVGVPRQVRPEPGKQLEGNTLMWESGGAPPSLSITTLSLTDETPHWRIISEGAITQLKLPDPATFGLPAWPAAPMIWRQWLIHIPGFDFDTYTYSQLSSGYWDRWSFDEFEIVVP